MSLHDDNDWSGRNLSRCSDPSELRYSTPRMEQRLRRPSTCWSRTPASWRKSTTATESRSTQSTSVDEARTHTWPAVKIASTRRSSCERSGAAEQSQSCRSEWRVAARVLVGIERLRGDTSAAHRVPRHCRRRLTTTSKSASPAPANSFRPAKTVTVACSRVFDAPRALRLPSSTQRNSPLPHRFRDPGA